MNNELVENPGENHQGVIFPLSAEVFFFFSFYRPTKMIDLTWIILFECYFEKVTLSFACAQLRAKLDLAFFSPGMILEPPLMIGNLRYQQLRDIGGKINGYSKRFIDDCFLNTRSDGLIRGPKSSSLLFVCLPEIPALTDKLRFLARDVLNVVSRPNTWWSMFLRKAKYCCL